jgi:LmbE family N-acetylglucosaminyl deacetylase
MKTALVISPHADDAAAFCGATLAKWSAQGWRLILIRVTDDQKDSVGLSIAETIAINTQELRAAAKILGVEEIIELGFETDSLADVPLGKLRERMVYLFRKYRPYAVMTFDPFGLYEGNQDHIRTAQAVEEAFWVACFDKHYPEHFSEGLMPFSVCERWYFARQLPEISHYEDVSMTMVKKIEALCAHREMMRNTIQQTRLQLQTYGKRLRLLDGAMEDDLAGLLGLVLQQQGRTLAIQAGWEGGEKLAEAFRVVRFGDLEKMVEALAEPL